MERLRSMGPLVAAALVWLTTAGHTLNFREMAAAKGWVPAESYSLHSAYLLAIGLTLLLCPRLLGYRHSRGQALAGLGLFALGSFINGIAIHWPVEGFVLGRVLAGIGGGVILFSVPNLLEPHWETVFLWVSILLPPLGPTVIAGASFLYGWSAWEGGFLFEGFFALVCLVGIMAMPMAERGEPRVAALDWPLHYWPWLAVAVIGIWYCLHWGQLDGWYESPRALVAMAAGTLGLLWVAWLLAPATGGWEFRHNWLRFLLIAYAGSVQFFHGTTMTIYSGLFVNLDVWQRSWLVWSMPIGVALALGLAALWLRRTSLGRGAIFFGLVVLAAGMYLLHQQTMGWPYWDVQNVQDLHWYRAPLWWQLAPGRIVAGFGLGWLMASVTALASPRPAVELHVRQLFPVVQTLAGGLAIGVLVTWLMIGHQVQYSYTSENVGTFQTQELSQRLPEWQDELVQHGASPAAAGRQALALIYKGVNYQAYNQTYAEFYAGFGAVALTLAIFVALVGVWQYAKNREIATSR